MAILGITGGIATGKSTFVRELISRANVKFFDADLAARELFNDENVLTEVREVFGSSVFSEKNIINRERLRKIVFADPGGRLKLEKILHPRIRVRWLEEARRARSSGLWYAVDIPLLFEKGAQEAFDCVIVIACSAATQWQRLMTERNLSEEVASQIVAAQMPLNKKMVMADHVIWSEGSLACLRNQLSLLLRYLKAPLRQGGQA